MARCDIIPLEQKACTGKCRNGECITPSRIWVLAACGGMIALLEKNALGKLSPISVGESAVFSSMDQFTQFLDSAAANSSFAQLVIIGGKSDTAWVHASLPHTVIAHIAAEIEYPLLPAWLKQPMPMAQLTHALESVFVI